MTVRILSLIALGTLSVLLAGCATTAYQPRYSYYQVPCNTPGAVIAVPVVGPGGVAVTPAPDVAVIAAPGVAVAAPGAPAVATCIVAVSDRDYGYRSSYYDGYGRYRGYYGSPFYGSFGFGFSSFGGHHDYSGGHYSGGHHSTH